MPSCPAAHDQTQRAAGGTLPCGRSDPRGVRGAAAQRVWTEGPGPEPGGGEVRGTTQGEQCEGVNVGGTAWAPPRARPQPQPASSCSRDTSGGQASVTAPPPTLAGSRGRPRPGPGRQGPAWEEGGTPRAEHAGRGRPPPGVAAEAPVERPAGIGSTAPQRGQSSQGGRSPGGDAAHRLADTAGQRIPRCPGCREARVGMPQKLRDWAGGWGRGWLHTGGGSVTRLEPGPVAGCSRGPGSPHSPSGGAGRGGGSSGEREAGQVPGPPPVSVLVTQRGDRSSPG